MDGYLKHKGTRFMHSSWRVALAAVACASFGVGVDRSAGSEAERSAGEHRPAGTLELNQGDRVVLLGSAFIERLQAHNNLETQLVARLARKEITFRNLGWSGDTVQGIARAVFGTPEEGFQRLMKDVREAQPTVIVVAYGNNDAHAGVDGLPAFEQQLNRLLDELGTTGARIALVTPRPYARKPAPLPDPQPYNVVLEQYSEVLRRVADQRGLPVLDLHADASSDPAAKVETTPDGVHLTERGYWAISLRLADLLGLGPARWELDYDATTGQYNAVNTSVQEIHNSEQRVRWVLLDRQLPPPFLAGAAEAAMADGLYGTIRVRGLAAGRYQLLIDGLPVVEADASQWAGGQPLPLRGGHEQVEQLRAVINEKNQLYFHRYRPQNETYLFLFRKHEQGNNAVEIPQFEPLVAECEQQIAALGVPQKHSYELVRIH